MLHSVERSSAPNGIRQTELASELKRLAPFHHDIELPYGMRTYLPEASRQERERTRMDALVNHAWPSLLSACGGSLKGLRVLDVACNCGGFSVQAARSGADYVLGFDVDTHYLEQADLVKRALNLDGVEFRQMRMEELDPEVQGTFDVSLCFGILYHLENPILAMQKLAAVTTKVMLIDTTLMRIPYLNVLLRHPLWHMRVVPAVTTDATNISTSHWRQTDYLQFAPNRRAVERLLPYIGFRTVTYIQPKRDNPERRYHNGTRATFLAER